MTRHLIGTWRDEDGTLNRMAVDVELSPLDKGDSWRTIDHEAVPAGYRLSIQGTTTYQSRNGRWMEGSCGQNRDDLPLVTDFASGWTAERRDRLVEIWDRWHLNDMRAGCAHQTVEYETDRYGWRVSSLTLTEPCPLTGYRYGSAWLVDPLPEEIVDWARKLGAVPKSDRISR